jgi:hypothetical protein
MACDQKFHVTSANNTVGRQAQPYQFLPHSFTPDSDPAIQEVPYSRQIPIIQEDLNIQPRIEIPQANPGFQQPNSLFGDPAASRPKAGILRSGKNVPPRIDPTAASKIVRRVC